MPQFLLASFIGGLLLVGVPVRAQSRWKAGVASVVITPQEPIEAKSELA